MTPITDAGPPLHGYRGTPTPPPMVSRPLGVTVAISREAGSRGGSIAAAVGATARVASLHAGDARLPGGGRGGAGGGAGRGAPGRRGCGPNSSSGDSRPSGRCRRGPAPRRSRGWCWRSQRGGTQSSSDAGRGLCCRRRQRFTRGSCAVAQQRGVHESVVAPDRGRGGDRGEGPRPASSGVPRGPDGTRHGRSPP